MANCSAACLLGSVQRHDVGPRASPSASCRASARLGPVAPLPFVPQRQRPSNARKHSSRLAAAAQQATEPAGPVTEGDFQAQVLDSPVPVIVDFWAPWCGPCRMIGPLIDEIAVEYGDKLRAFKLNTDESPSIATEYGIRSIPTVIIYKGGKRVEAVIGAVPKQTLMKAIDKFID